MKPICKHGCDWFLGMDGHQCQLPSTHFDPDSKQQFCIYHAVDYAEIFGNNSLRKFPKKEVKP